MTQLNIKTSLVNAYKRKMQFDYPKKVKNKDVEAEIEEWLYERVNY